MARSKPSVPDVDVELMRRVASGDESAIEELYDRFGSLVYRMSLQAMPTRADAEDAVQEIFVRLWQTAKRFDPKRAALVTWIMLISRRHLVDRLRRSNARIRSGPMQVGSPDRTPAPPDAARLEEDERFRVLRTRLAELPELQRIVVTRAYLGGQTLRQIGEELNTPIGTIKSALSRALLRLRETPQTEGQP